MTPTSTRPGPTRRPARHAVLGAASLAIAAVVTGPPAAAGTADATAVLVRPADLGSAWRVVDPPGQPAWSPVRGTAPTGATCSGVATTFQALPWNRQEPWPGYAATVLRKGGRHLYQVARHYRNATLAQRDYQRFLTGAQPCTSFRYLTEIGELSATMTRPVARATASGLTYRFTVTDDDGAAWGVAVGTSGRFVVVTSTRASTATADRATRAAMRRG